MSLVLLGICSGVAMLGSFIIATIKDIRLSSHVKL